MPTEWQAGNLSGLMQTDAAHNLGNNIQSLREARGLTQHQIAKLADVPRATWANLESGSANPTLSLLVKVANALAVRLEELIEPPRKTGRLFRVSELPVRRKGDGSVRQLLPETIAGLELERMELLAGGAMTGVPHTPGTREYLTCEQGMIELSVSGEKFTLGPGDVVVFRGDQKHGYRNAGRSRAVAYSVIAFAPVAG